MARSTVKSAPVKKGYIHPVTGEMQEVWQAERKFATEALAAYKAKRLARLAERREELQAS